MLSRSQSGRILALHRRKGRDDAGEFLVEGVRLVEELLDSPIVTHMALVSPSLEDNPRGRQLAARLRDSVTVLDVSDAELGRLATTETVQGVVAIAAIPRVALGETRLAADSLIVVLDAVQDPGNFGSIVRSADAFAAACVIALPGTVDPWNPKSVRSAAGSSLRVPIVEGSIDDAVTHVRARDGVLLGADVNGTPVSRSDARGVVALALGNEGAGLSDAVRAACDRLVAVPIRGAAESLNVGVAAGILMYLLSQRS